MSLLLVEYVLTAAIRDKLLLSFLLLLCVGTSLSFFMGSAAVNEQDQFATVFAASGLRIAAAVGLVLFVIFHLRRSFEARDVEYLLSRPISRFQFLMSHFIAFFILALISAVLVTITAMFVSGGRIEFPALMIWGGSLLVEFTVMVTISLFFGMVLTSAVAASMMTMAFYVLGRLIGQIHGIIESKDTGGIYEFLEYIMAGISIFVPRLDLMGQSAWLLYGFDAAINLEIVFVQALVFCGLIFAAAYVDLSRKQF